MKTLKKVIAMGIAAVMTTACMGVGAFAEENLADSGYEEIINQLVDDSTNVDLQEDSLIEYESIPVINVTEETDQDELANSIAGDNLNSATRSYTQAGYYLIRDGNTTTCELYIYWRGDAMFSAWTFDKISIADRNSEYVYSYIISSWVPCEMSTSGSVYVSDVWVPLDVSKVRVKADGLKAYNPNTGKYSQTLLNEYQNVTIN